MTNGMLTCHHGLKIPADTDKCAIVANERPCDWARGQFFVVNDTPPSSGRGRAAFVLSL